MKTFIVKNFRYMAICLFVALLGYQAITLHLWKELTYNIINAIFLVQPLMILSYLVTGMRYAILIRMPEKDCALMTGINSIALLNILSFVMPGRLAEAVKVIYPQKKENIPVGTSIAAIALEKVLDLCVLCTMIFLLVSFHISTRTMWPVEYATAAALIFLIFLPIIMPTLKKYFSKFITSLRIKKFLKDTLGHLQAKSRNYTFIFAAFMTLLIWTCNFLVIYLYIRISTEIHFSILQTITLGIFTVIGSAVAILPGGVGTFELAAVYVLSFFNYPINTAIVIGIGLHISQISIFPVYGLWLMLRENGSFKSTLSQIKLS